MGDLGDILGKAIGGLFGVVESGAKAFVKYSAEHSSYYVCPHCGHEQLQPDKYAVGGNDTGRRTCKKCDRYFYIQYK